jgi:antitoxin (DNA-binding transcriptional repressor) of toxin-antitoxin stability system
MTTPTPRPAPPIAAMRSVGAFEAKTHLAALLDAVGAGSFPRTTRRRRMWPARSRACEPSTPVNPSLASPGCRSAAPGASPMKPAPGRTPGPDHRRCHSHLPRVARVGADPHRPGQPPPCGKTPSPSHAPISSLPTTPPTLELAMRLGLPLADFAAGS